MSVVYAWSALTCRPVGVLHFIETHIYLRWDGVPTEDVTAWEVTRACILFSQS